MAAPCAFIQLVLPPPRPRPLLTAGSSPPFPRAAETSGGPGARVFRQPPVPGGAGWAGPDRIPRGRQSRPATPLPTCGEPRRRGLKRVSPLAAGPLAAKPGGSGHAVLTPSAGAAWESELARRGGGHPETTSLGGAEDAVLSWFWK